MLEKKVPVDRVLFVDTTKEFPQMYQHVARVQEFCPVEIETVKLDFDYWFGEHVTKSGELGYGFTTIKFRWCSGLKGEALRVTAGGRPYHMRRSGQKSIKHVAGKNIYIGYSADETRRCKKYGNERYPLIEWGVSGPQALAYCYSKGLNWGGLYEKFVRVSCWCCPFKRIGELKTLYKEFPELWAKLVEMDKKSPVRFSSYYSVQDLVKKFTTKVYKTAEASKYLGISESTLKRLERRGVLSCVKTDGAHRVFTQGALDAYAAWVAARQEDPGKKVYGRKIFGGGLTYL